MNEFSFQDMKTKLKKKKKENQISIIQECEAWSGN